MTHVNRRPEDFQGAVDDFDRPVHTGAEATGVGEFDLHAVPRVLQLFGSGVTLTQPKMKIKGGRGGATIRLAPDGGGSVNKPLTVPPLSGASPLPHKPTSHI
ncbi:hypothetical protein cym2001_09470 [Pseudomonas sp. CYM-20-01]|nr:hypothetical protein cym2001_09470 [Pseudomonas sp. CYM-20-01]